MADQREPSAATSEERTERVPLHAPDLVRWCVSLLATSAWQEMGLIPDPATNTVERNLDDARLAIDAAAALIEHLRPRAADLERRELDNLLATLRLNFVEQAAKG
jgi:hypothetical protein